MYNTSKNLFLAKFSLFLNTNKNVLTYTHDCNHLLRIKLKETYKKQYMLMKYFVLTRSDDHDDHHVIWNQIYLIRIFRYKSHAISHIFKLNRLTYYGLLPIFKLHFEKSYEEYIQTNPSFDYFLLRIKTNFLSWNQGFLKLFQKKYEQTHT